MFAWVIYDIRKNKVRSRVAKRCKFYGLVRVQKSVFLGEIKGKWLRAMHLELANTINQRTDRLFIVPLSPAHFSRVLQAGAPPTIQQCIDAPPLRFIN
ncbi:MAG: CRISPR-associated endonuclease Cas2 [Saprospirales bacterium]|nr:CRISPR-associated endonuclease Cas2 [Saprospirales bacterium]